jgi:hypothetical protein
MRLELSAAEQSHQSMLPLLLLLLLLLCTLNLGNHCWRFCGSCPIAATPVPTTSHQTIKPLLYVLTAVEGD